MRIVFFYAPVWYEQPSPSSNVHADYRRLLAGTTMAIHTYVGIHVHKQLAPLRNFKKESQRSPTPSSSTALDDPFYDPKDKIVVTTEIERKDGLRSRSATPDTHNWLTPLPSPQKSTGVQSTEAPSTTRSSTPSSPMSPRHFNLIVPQNPNSPHRNKQPLLIGRYRATAYAAPLASGDFATLPSPRVPVFSPSEHAAHVKRCEENAAAFAYFKVALLLFLALVVVWVPSSINRLYQIVHPEQPSYGLNLASALVLPTQGFWNATVYATTSWRECKRAHAMIVSKLTGRTLNKQSSDVSEQHDAIHYNGSINTDATELSIKNSESVQTV